MSELAAMCSDVEIEFRRRVFDVHPLESTRQTKSLPQEQRVADRRKMIKKFSRSCGDSSQFEVRDIHTLDTCVEYLARLWVDPELEAPRESYEFIMNRMRAELVDLSFCAELARSSLYLKVLRTYVNIFSDCLTHHFVAPASYGFDRTLHTREIAKTLTSLLSNAHQLIVYPSEVVAEILGVFLLFTTFDRICIQLVGSIMQSTTSPVSAAASTATLMLPPRIDITGMSNHLLTCEQICSVWEAANPGQPSPMLNSNLRSVIRDVISLRNGFPFLSSKPSDAVEGGAIEQDDHEKYVLDGISLVYSRTNIESISSTRRLMYPLLQTWRLLLCNRVANRSESVSAHEVSRRLYLGVGQLVNLCKVVHIKVIVKDSSTTMMQNPSSSLDLNPLPDFIIVFKDISTDGAIDSSCKVNATTTIVDSVSDNPESILRQILLACHTSTANDSSSG